MIRRKAYKYKRKDGKVIHVKSTMIKDTGKKGRTPKNKRVLPKLEPGKLSGYGYSTRKTKKERQKALMKASKVSGKLSKDKMLQTMRRLTVLKNYTRTSQPSNYRKYNVDGKWLREKYFKLK